MDSRGDVTGRVLIKLVVVTQGTDNRKDQIWEILDGQDLEIDKLQRMCYREEPRFQAWEIGWVIRYLNIQILNRLARSGVRI